MTILRLHKTYVLIGFNCVQLFVTPWSVALQVFLSVGLSRLEWIATPSSRGSSQPRDRTHISYISRISRQVLYHWCHLGILNKDMLEYKEL